MTPDWLRDSVARGSPLPCADYAALPDLRQADEKLGPHTPHCNSPPTRSQSPLRAASTDGIPPAYLLHPPVPPPEVKLDHTAHLCCSRPSPLVCPNQPLCDALDVLRRGRALESNERSALSYGRAIAVSVILPSFHPLRSQLAGLVGCQRCSCMLLMLSARLLTGGHGHQRSREKLRPRSVGKYRNCHILARRFPRWWAAHD